MHYINIKTGEVVSDNAAHGSGSGKTNTPTNINDVSGSNSTSGGFFETAEVYTSMECPNPKRNKRKDGTCRVALVIRRTFGGERNNAVKLIGLTPSNAKAWARGVVHHGATYVNSSTARWSSGCPAPQLKTFRKMRYEIDKGAMMYLHTIKQENLDQPEC
jgi:hypothetical protein